MKKLILLVLATAFLSSCSIQRTDEVVKWPAYSDEDESGSIDAKFLPKNVKKTRTTKSF